MTGEQMGATVAGGSHLLSGVFAMMVLALTTGCSREERETSAAVAALRDGSAKATLQQYFDKQRECAPVLSFDRSASLLDAEKSNPGAQALVAVGLIEPVPGHSRPERSYFRPAPAARQWFAFQNPAAPGEPQLCYGRRLIKQVTLDVSNGWPGYRYTFDIVDPAPWLDRPEMRKAFPGVVMAMFNNYAGMEDIMSDGGRPRLKFVATHSDNPPLPDFGVNFTGHAVEDRIQSKRLSTDQH